MSILSTYQNLAVIDGKHGLKITTFSSILELIEHMIVNEGEENFRTCYEEIPNILKKGKKDWDMVHE